MTRRHTAKPKALMMKARSNQQAANRGVRLARAALMCGPGSKICPPERATELLEAIIEPGDRVVIEGDNQKQCEPTPQIIPPVDLMHRFMNSGQPEAQEATGGSALESHELKLSQWSEPDR